jgi:hypothetical protein
LGPALPLFILSCIAVAALIFESAFMKCLRKNQSIMLDQVDVEVNEALGSYYDCLPAFTRKAMVAEEYYNRERLGIK